MPTRSEEDNRTFPLDDTCLPKCMYDEEEESGGKILDSYTTTSTNNGKVQGL